MKATSFQTGSTFIVKGDIDKTVYVFDYIEYKNNSACIHCIEEGKEVILEETNLSEIEHI